MLFIIKLRAKKSKQSCRSEFFLLFDKKERNTVTEGGERWAEWKEFCDRGKKNEERNLAHVKTGF